MEVFLRGLLPKMLDNRTTYAIYAHQGKSDLLGKLRARLRAYATWLPDDWRIILIVDRDNDNCQQLKNRLDLCATSAGLRTKAPDRRTWQIANRIAIEELEAWYFGEWSAVMKAFPNAPSSVPRRARFRASDAIAGGTWEALERILGKAGYFTEGLRKIEAARAIGAHIDPAANSSPSFTVFRQVILEMLQTDFSETSTVSS